MTEKRFDFNIRGIAATAYMSDGAVNCPTLLVCHGWGGNRRLWRLPEKVKNKAIKRGVAIVSIDFFGCGDSIGDYKDMTYGIWAQNIADVVEYIKGQAWCDSARIGVMGFSSGSTAALRFAADISQPALLVLVATCCTSDIGMAEGGPYEALASGEATRVFLGKKVARGFFEDCINNAPADRLTRITCPTLILQGEADNIYRIKDAHIAETKIKDCRLLTYSGGTHSLDNCATQAANDILTFVYRHFAISSEIN